MPLWSAAPIVEEVPAEDAALIVLATAATLASAVLDALLRRDGGGEGKGGEGGEGCEGGEGGAFEGAYPAGGGLGVTGRLSLGDVMRTVRSPVITPTMAAAQPRRRGAHGAPPHRARQ